jgi:16S rRNA (uracil1498-N3)-methyltransferase
LDEAGTHWTVEVVEDRGDRLFARVDRSSSVEHTFCPPITLYQAIPKGRKLDETIRQLVQAGVGRIRPVVTNRTVVRTDGSGGRIERWRRIAREAVQQSGAEKPAEIYEPCPLKQVTRKGEALSFILHTKPLAPETLHDYLGDIPSEIELIVGPEGGFDESEIEYLLGAGFRPLWLGSHVLRSESAALFAVAAMRILILERASWQSATPGMT